MSPGHPPSPFATARFLFLGLLGLLLLAFAPATARAVIVATGDGTQNATSTGAGAGWDYVGSVGGASGVYLGAYGGDHWVLTAWHVGPGTFTLGANSYTAVADSSVRLQNADLSFTDLRLFKISVSTPPGLPNLEIVSTSVPNTTALTLIGYGRNRATDLSRWNVTGVDPNYVWTPVGSGGNASGYAWAAGNTKRWGTNTREAASTFNAGFGNVTGYYTDFDAVANEAQGSTGDSGGGAFYYDTESASWKLAGLMLAIGGYPNQPGSTSVHGNVTYIADLAAYKAAIYAVIPEPATLALWLGGGTLLLASLRRRRTSLRM